MDRNALIIDGYDKHTKVFPPELLLVLVVRVGGKMSALWQPPYVGVQK
jgi:hypothetical protein